MTLLQIGLLLGKLALLQTLFLGQAQAQSFGEQCLTEFRQGKEDFILDVEESVKEGATFISSPPVTNMNDCILSCCKDPRCNLALMQNGEQGLITSCYIFDCLYKQKKVCRFIRKRGFNNYILISVFGKYFDESLPSEEEDLPPIANPGQDRVVQPQDAVTLNGIESKDDHKIVKFQWRLMSGNPSAIIEKTHFDDQVMVSNLSSGVYKFQLMVTDSIGQSNAAQVTILVLTAEQSENHCLVPKKVGPCRGSFPRWHYNAVTEKCEDFMFGGCRENHNNYLSKGECSKACGGVSVIPSPGGRSGPLPLPPEVCGVPCGPTQFTCTNRCCLDKGLECDNHTQCSDGSDEESCTKLDDQFRILLQIPVDEQQVRCTEPPRTGPCRASMTNWYYDPFSQMCFHFNYGGCQGNENRFENEDNCMRTCRTVTKKDVFARRGAFEYQASQSQSGTIAVAVLLGVGILILLVVLGYCFLKRRKEQPPRHQRVAVNGAHARTIEDTEKLVYNSTTKPI